MEFPISIRVFSKLIPVEVSPVADDSSFPLLLYGNFALTAQESEVPVEVTVLAPVKVGRAAAIGDKRALSVRFRTVRFLRNFAADAVNA